MVHTSFSSACCAFGKGARDLNVFSEGQLYIEVGGEGGWREEMGRKYLPALSSLTILELSSVISG